MNEVQEQYARIIHALINVEGVDYSIGDFSYGLSNYIAKYSLANDKYYISETASQLISNIFGELPPRLLRSSKQGEDFTYDHAIPVNIIKTVLLNLEVKNFQAVTNILQLTDVVVIITNDENRLLNENGLKQNLPNNAQWHNNIENFIRYNHLNIPICEETINMFGAIIR